MDAQTHSTAHLDVVVHGEVDDGLGIRAPELGVGGEGGQAVEWVAVQEVLQHQHVLHALDVERERERERRLLPNHTQTFVGQNGGVRVTKRLW